MMMMIFIILFVAYLIFWIVTFALIKNYISNLIDGIRNEVMSIGRLAKDYLKK